MTYQPIAADSLRWQLNEQEIPAQSSRDLIPADARATLQPAALAAMERALRLAPTFERGHVFVRGEPGTGRRRLVREVLSSTPLPAAHAVDLCFVHNFARPDRPRLIRLRAGQGRDLQRLVDEIGLFVRDRLDEALRAPPVRSRLDALEDRAEREIRKLLAPFEQKIRAKEITVIRSEVGHRLRLTLAGRRMDSAIPAEEMANLVLKGQLSTGEFEAFEAACDSHRGELADLSEQVNQKWQTLHRLKRRILEEEARGLMAEVTAPVLQAHPSAEVRRLIEEITSDVLEKRVGRDTRDLADPALLYSVNLVGFCEKAGQAPVVEEFHPSSVNLFGTIDPAWLASGRAVSSYRGIRGGALVEADGGFLVLDARDVLAEPGLWTQLVRVLRTGWLEIAPPGLGWPHSANALKPEPVPVHVRVILLGDVATGEELARIDPDFERLFQLRVDLEATTDRSRESVLRLCRTLALHIEQRGLMHLDRSGLAAAVEYAARLAGQDGRLLAGCQHLGPLLAAAADLARAEEHALIGREQFERVAVGAPGLPGRALETQLRRIARAPANPLRGRMVGRVNCVLPAPDDDRPAGILVGVVAVAGRGDGLRVEFDAPEALAPAKCARLEIRLKSLVSGLLGSDAPLDLRLAIGLELYSDAARLDRAEGLISAGATCAALSQLAGVALRQDLIVAAAADPMGQMHGLEDITGAAETVFDLAGGLGRAANQGVVIARASQRDLMLRPDVVRACANEIFSILAVDNIRQLLEMLSGMRTGDPDLGGADPDSLLFRARERLAGWAGNPADQPSPASPAARASGS